MTGSTNRSRVGSDTLTRNSYFLTAMAVLAEEGPAALTVTELCSRLGVTKGSFYHHFSGRPQFVQGLLRYWVEEHSWRLIEISRSVDGARARIGALKAVAAAVPHDAEAAIRAWSSEDRQVAEAQARVDQLRLDHLKEAYAAVGVVDARASVLATIAMSVLAGLQLLVRPTQPQLVNQVFDELEAAFFGPSAPPG